MHLQPNFSRYILLYMENHPIPQDVTGFQFKLVGNMTIKQFAYVAGGAIMSVILFYLPIALLVKFPLLILFATSGVALAFLPVEGRPMDTMVVNFFNAITRPNQYAYHKIGGRLSFTDLELHSITPQTVAAAQAAKNQPKQHVQNKEERLREYLYDLSSQPKTAIDEKESSYLSTLGQEFAQYGSAPILTRPIAQPPAAVQAPTRVQLPVEPLPQPTVNPASAVNVAPNPTPQPTQPVMPNVQQPAVAPTPVQIPQTQSVAQTTAIQPSIPVAQPVTAAAAIDSPPAVQAISQKQASAAGAPTLPQSPNLVSGIIKDSRGNVLPGILVEVKNADGESVRAFKTNPLGQFVSATQLGNGTYTIEFEDPKKQHTFEKVQVTIDGGILPGLMVTSLDAREELRKSLFG